MPMTSVAGRSRAGVDPPRPDRCAGRAGRAQRRRAAPGRVPAHGAEPRVVECEGASLANLTGFLGLSDVSRLVLDVGHAKIELWCLLVDGRPIALRRIPIAALPLHGRADARPAPAAPTSRAGAQARPGHLRARQHQARLERRARSARASGPRGAALRPVGGAAIRSIPSRRPEVVLVGGSARLPGLARVLRGAHRPARARARGDPQRRRRWRTSPRPGRRCLAQARARSRCAAPPPSA